MQLELLEVALKNGRYAWEAYEFTLAALTHAQRMFGKEAPSDSQSAGPEHHITGRELLEGVCDFARREFGLMAPVVFQCWGIRRTGDFGEIVFHLIDAAVLFKTDSDRREDFDDVFDLEQALSDGYQIPADGGDRARSSR
ncbi:MAG: Minf_1886 family protein [Gemmataceae bacterium]